MKILILNGSPRKAVGVENQSEEKMAEIKA